MRTTSRLSVAVSVRMRVCASVVVCLRVCANISHATAHTPTRAILHTLPFRIAHKTANLKMKTAGQAVMRCGRVVWVFQQRGGGEVEGKTSVCRIIHFLCVRCFCYFPPW